MTHKNYLRVLWLLAATLTGFAGKGIAQTNGLWNPNHSIGTITGNTNFSYNQIPDEIVEIYSAAIGGTNLTYQWQYSLSPLGPFVNIPATGAGVPQTTGTTLATLTFTAPLTQTTYFQRKTISNLFLFLLGIPVITNVSNILKIRVVSVNWEDYNYIREHDVITTGITTWQAMDQLPIGQKLQTTNYLDGLGRSVEKVSRQTATPGVAGNPWGDMVQFHAYDQMGREPIRYLPYTTTTQSGQFKTTPLTEQPQYYTNTYNETSAYNAITFDNSPLNRVVNVKESGTSWASGPGEGSVYDVNSLVENVQIWSVDYVQGDAPVNNGPYPANSLYKLGYTDENNKQVIEYSDVSGKLILKKVQLDNTPSVAHAGWICTYSVYDDRGLLRYQIQPEGVKYLDANGWSFAGPNGPTVLAEQCFQYNYDAKGRTVEKKAPGVAPLNMLYDSRDRLVFMQDGNQAALTTPQWTANLYDALDRPVLTTLYNSTETIASLQNDIGNATPSSTITTTATVQPLKDLVVTTRQPGIAVYSAQNTVTFTSEGNGSFQSATGDQFVAQIDPSATTSGYTAAITAQGNPISAANLANASVTTIIKYFFYDNYSFGAAKSFDNNFTNSSAYSSSDPNVLPIAATARTSSMLTGGLTRVLGTNLFLASTEYYDEKGRLIQSLKDNIKSGTDIATQQYHFDGRLLSSCSIHSAPGTDYSSFTTLTKFIFDLLGRVTSIQKQFGNNPFKTISAYDYDDVGRVKTQHLDPNYNNPNSGAPDLESLNYSFNIHNQITGINKDYALKNPADYNKWGHFFGLYLGFDNRDNVFAKAQLNGQVTGQQWNTQGDDAQRKYDYSYDNSGRLINAAYNEQQHPGDGWSNGKMDFSVSGTSGQITYDNNGNLLTMLQKGVLPGTSTPIAIDDLRYAYNSFSNRLQSVTDQMPATSFNGQFGDFKDGSNATGTADYVYDNNGNLVVDLNKNVQSLNNGAPGVPGISYNFLDKPEQIRIVGQGTIKIVYSADGEKLQRVFIPESGAPSMITSYINEFVYQETAALTLSSSAPFSGSPVALSYINFEEGRIRVMTPVSQNNGYDALTENGNIVLPNGKMGIWDYFVRDYQHNVRMILTEETHSAVNTCTMETNRAAAEDPVFGQTGAANEVEKTRTTTPPGWQSVNSSVSVSQLGNLIGFNIGPNTLQKVMSGDNVSATVQYYYASSSTSSNPNIIPNILNSLAAALGGNATAGTLVHGNIPNITNQLQGTPGFVSAVEPSNSTSGTPQAYLTLLFFDERFNFISAADGGVAQQQVASSWTTTTTPLGLLNIKAPKNGYVYAYVSNRSDQTVYFDNLVVGITTGNIIEEDHYYAFGLKIAAISSKKLGDVGEGALKNNYLYNDKELFDDGNLDWYDYGFRNYDPQIGRFPQLDPLTDDYPELTPFQYASNDPIANTDEDGLEAAGALAPTDALSLSGFKDFFQGSKSIDQIPAVVRAVKPVTASAAALQSVKVATVTSILLHTATLVSDEINKQNTPTGQGGLTPEQERTTMEDYRRMNTPRDGDPNGRIHMATPWQVENYPIKAFFLDAGYYIAEFTPIKSWDDAISTYKDPNASVDKKIESTGDAILAGAEFDEEGGMRGKGEIQRGGTSGDESQAWKDQIHGHHSYPKALGGDPDQELSELSGGEHIGQGGVHSDLSKFEGGWLSPKKGMSGEAIVKKYGADKVIEGLRRFYSQDKWKHLLPDFEKAVKFTQGAKK